MIDLKTFVAGYGERAVLDVEKLTINEVGAYGLVGPSGGGKSTLIKSLAGAITGVEGYWSRGTISVKGVPIQQLEKDSETETCFPILEQKARITDCDVITLLCRIFGSDNTWGNLEKITATLRELGIAEEIEPLLEKESSMLSYGQQKLVLIAAYVSLAPQVIILDEPTRNMSQNEEQTLATALKSLRTRLCVIVVSHDKQFVSENCDNILLLVGGFVVEEGSVAEFFQSPVSEAGRNYLSSRESWPLFDAAEKNRDIVCDENVSKIGRSKNSINLTWIVDKMLGGATKPGLLTEVASDLRQLRSEGVDVLVTLTEDPITELNISQYGFQNIHFPIVDMNVPSDIRATDRLITYVNDCIENGVSVVFHCKAGLGRTGLLLACALVKLGMDPEQAIEKLRCIRQRYIQTDEQEEYVQKYAHFLSSQDGSTQFSSSQSIAV